MGFFNQLTACANDSSTRYLNMAVMVLHANSKT
jgi:hypothetical protein